MNRRSIESARGLRGMFAVAFTVALFVCAFGVARVWAQSSAITDLELRAGERGVILTIIGSGPIAIGGGAESLEAATARYTDVRVKISKARWLPLNENSSFAPPEMLPLKEISVKESGDGVEIGLKMRSVTDGPIQIRDGGNQVRMLLTKAPQPEVVWSAVRGIVSGGVVAPAQSRPDVTIPSDADPERVLGNIRVVERDNTAALYLDFNSPPVAAVARIGDSLRITFAGAALSPKLSVQSYNVAGSAYPMVRISRGKGADGRNTVIAVVRLKFKDAAPVMAQDGNKYVIRVSIGSNNQVFLWNAHTGVQSSQQFADIKPEPIDMKKMEARAARDTQPFKGDQMFAVKDGSQATAAPPQKQIPVTAQPRLAAKPETPAVQEFHDSEPAAVSPKPGEGLVRYKVYGRDPFVPLVRDPNDDSELPNVENLRLVGVLEDSRERIALLEDFSDNNRAYALRVGDPVEYGKVLRVHRDKVVFLIRDFDVSRSYTLGISRDAESGRARR